MSHDDAIALIAVSLEALIHRRHVSPGEALTHMPLGLLKLALNQIDERGEDTSSLRAEFTNEGFDLSESKPVAEIVQGNSPAHDESRLGPSASRVPKVIADAIFVKYHDGWSKSRIAREFRLNRRTIIRICGGRSRQTSSG